MKVNRPQEWHRIERRCERVGEHGINQAAPTALQTEDQVDPWDATVGEREDGVLALLGAVVFENFLNHDVVESSGDGEQISEVGHREGGRPSSSRASSL